VEEWLVAEGEAGERLDHLVAARAGISHAASRRVVDDGAVRLNGKRAKKGARVAAGDRVAVLGLLPRPAALRPIAEPDVPLDVLASDEDFVAVNKPPGVPSHPLRAGERGTLAGALVARFPECADAGADPREAGLVHRLDGDTSGVLVAARNRPAWESLRAAFHDGRARKRYLALVVGTLSGSGTIEMALVHDPGDRRKARVVPRDTPGGREAFTEYRPIAFAPGVTLVEAHTSTGRMHQVRAHLAHLGHPIAGDLLYGGPPPHDGAPGHFLHASWIALPHPRGGTLEAKAPLPRARLDLLVRLGVRLTAFA
jgi:23S rRNA pseudouridine1911/1915/1917 synthase